jgi:glutamine synthetase
MFLNCSTSDDVLEAIKANNVQMIDLRFTDLPGTWQHFSVPPSAVDADAMSEGIGFDGSSIRGFQEIQESDMLVVPDPTTAFLDPFTPATTLVLICNKPVLLIRPISGRKRNFSFSTTFVTVKASTSPTTRSTRRKASGIQANKKLRTLATSHARKRATFRFLPSTVCKTYAPRWH